MKFQNLILVGTSHIAKQSLTDVKNAVSKYKPKIICVELDKQRFIALTHKQKTILSIGYIFRIGLKGYLFALVGHYVEKKLGNLVGMSPGDEMLLAVSLAKKTGANIGLIDQDINITLSRFSKALTWKEKWIFIKDIFRSIFFKKRVLKEYGIKSVRIDLNKVPDKEFIVKIMKMTKKKYPNLYRVLVHERNIYMARKLYSLMTNFSEDNIVAVVGAGHVDGIMDIVKKKFKE